LLATAAACARAPRPDTLVILHGRDVEGLDPHLAGGIWQTQSVLANMYEGLVAVDAKMALSPALAASWSNPDESTWEFRLRPGVKFHTGDPLEAEDVVFSLLRARDDPRSALRSALAGVREVKALPGLGVRIRTELPDAYLAARLREVLIVSRRFVAAHKEGAFVRASCGTGPYRLVAWRPGDYVDVARWDGWWRGRAPIPKARFVAREFTSPDAGSFVPATGRILFMGTPGTPAYERALEEAVPHFAATLSISYLGFDLRSAATPEVRLPGGKPGNPFLDPKVRDAVARCVRLGALVEARHGEGYYPTQLVPQVVFGYDPAIKPAGGDLEDARREMAQTPFASGFDVVLDLRRAMSGYEELARDLAAIGIRVKVRVSPDDEFFRRLRDGGSSLYVLRFSCRTGDAQELFDKWVHSRDEKRGLGVFNFSYERCPVPGLDEAIDAARGELNPAMRRERLQGVMRRVMEARIAVPLFTEKDYTFGSPDLVVPTRADTFRLVSEMSFSD
jgi:peptide/nickel transport system substrate-binding protein